MIAQRHAHQNPMIYYTEVAESFMTYLKVAPDLRRHYRQPVAALSVVAICRLRGFIRASENTSPSICR